MITNEFGYQQTLYWLKVFEEDLERTKQRYLPDHPDLFNIYAGGTIAQIEQFHQEIAEYEKIRETLAA